MGELDYSVWNDYHYQIAGTPIPLAGVVGGIYAERLDNMTIYLMPGFVVGKFEGSVGMGLIIRYPQPFDDFMGYFNGLSFNHSKNYELVPSIGDLIAAKNKRTTATEKLQSYSLLRFQIFLH